MVTEAKQTKPLIPEFAYRDIDYFFRKKKFLGHSHERNVTSVYSDRAALNLAVKELQANGFRNDDIFITTSHHGTVLDTPLRIVSIAPFLTPLGILVGLILGGLMGWLTQMGTLQFFGIQPFVMDSGLVAASASSAVGGFVGGILGLIYGMRIPEYNPWKYETSAPQGTLFLVVRTVNEEETTRAAEVLDMTMDANTHPVVSEELAA